MRHGRDSYPISGDRIGSAYIELKFCMCKVYLETITVEM